MCSQQPTCHRSIWYPESIPQRPWLVVFPIPNSSECRDVPCRKTKSLPYPFFAFPFFCTLFRIFPSFPIACPNGATFP